LEKLGVGEKRALKRLRFLKRFLAKDAAGALSKDFANGASETNAAIPKHVPRGPRSGRVAARETSPAERRRSTFAERL
jgi:hypothetical protein